MAGESGLRRLQLPDPDDDAREVSALGTALEPESGMRTAQLVTLRVQGYYMNRVMTGRARGSTASEPGHGAGPEAGIHPQPRLRCRSTLHPSPMNALECSATAAARPDRSSPASARRSRHALPAVIAVLLSWALSSPGALPPAQAASGSPGRAAAVSTALPLMPEELDAADQQLLASVHGTWQWPVTIEPTVVRDFDPPSERWLAGHRGTDLTVGLNGEVLAPADGRVSHVGTVVDRATITIDHGDGLRSSFEPVESDLRKGDRVRKGQVIGVLSGRNHCLSTVRACMHWGVRLHDEYVHPLPFVGAQRPSVLLPLP